MQQMLNKHAWENRCQLPPWSHRSRAPGTGDHQGHPNRRTTRAAESGSCPLGKQQQRSVPGAAWISVHPPSPQKPWGEHCLLHQREPSKSSFCWLSWGRGLRRNWTLLRKRIFKKKELKKGGGNGWEMHFCRGGQLNLLRRFCSSSVGGVQRERDTAIPPTPSLIFKGSWVSLHCGYQH